VTKTLLPISVTLNGAKPCGSRIGEQPVAGKLLE
jgi:hypothetical protein